MNYDGRPPSCRPQPHLSLIAFKYLAVLGCGYEYAEGARAKQKQEMGRS